ncbi:hypothetical protein ABMA28_012912 [Loxostege sticticalis]|uniref:Regulatory protein zeste n=1 Tax=Loxostege sticticalis TaxID=481309 RepID=A0ABD0S5A8_LOXSC
MPAHRLVSEQQQQMLLTAMEADRDLALARVVPAAGPMAKQAASRKWEALASRLNAVGEGCTKSATSWKKPQLEEADAAPEHDAPADAASTSESEHRAENELNELCIPAVSQEESPHASGSRSVPAGSTEEPPRASGSGYGTRSEAVPPLPNISGLPTPTRPQPRFQADVPQWAIRMEERHLEFEERSARALEDINRTQHEIRDLLRTLLEVVQERLPRFDLF